jgi:tRNA threonylcarbamoyladenosine biosynthesis protein TsaB
MFNTGVRRQAIMEEPLVLAVETSSRIGSVALARGPVLLAESTFSAPVQHSAEVFPAISQLLSRFHFVPGDIAQVYIAIGPGSFTGLRIAVAMAKAMHLANATAIVTVNSLDVIATNTGDASSAPSLQDSDGILPDCIAVVLDAKRGEFYAAVYQRVGRAERTDQTAPAEDASYVIPAPGGRIWRKIVRDCLITADELVQRFGMETPLGVLGDGLLYHRDEFAAHNIRILDERYWSPRASNVHRLGCQKAQAGLFDDAMTLTPFYLRGPHVTLKIS